jgi:hypothetical protein
MFCFGHFQPPRPTQRRPSEDPFPGPVQPCPPAAFCRCHLHVVLLIRLLPPMHPIASTSLLCTAMSRLRSGD